MTFAEVTALKAAEEAAARRAERFRRAIREAPVPVLLYSEDGEILQHSRAFTEISGYEPEEIPTIEAWTERAYGERAPAVRDHIDRLFEREERVEDGLFRVRTKGGEERLWRFASAPVGTDSDTGLRLVLSTAVDVTDEEAARTELADAAVEIETVYGTAPVGIAYHDQDLRFIRVNERLAETNGLPVEDHLGKTLHDVVPLLADELEPHFRRVLDTGEPVEDFEVRGETPAAPGEERVWLCSYVPRRDGDGAIVGVHAVVRDITDRKRAEEDLAVRGRQQAAVSALGLNALDEPDLQAVLDRAVHTVRETLGVDYAKVLELQPDGEALLLRSGLGWNEGLVGEATVPNDRSSQAGYTLGAADPVIVTDFGDEDRFGSPDLLTEHGVQSGMSVVIQGEDRPFGVLGVHSRAPRAFSGADADFLQAAANVVAAAAERAEARARLERANAELEDRVEARTAALRESEERFGRMFRAAPVAIALENLEDGRYLDANAAYSELTGYGHDELVGQTATALGIPAEDADYGRAVGLFRDDGRVVAVEGRIRQKSGRLRDVLMWGEPVEIGGAPCVLAIAVDVTEQRRLEREVVDAAERERRRIGQDLHDDLGQQLTGAALLAQTLREKLDALGAAEASDAAFLAEVLGTTLADARGLSRLLSPVDALADGLSAALTDLADQVERMAAVGCRFVVEGDPSLEDATTATHLYRIAQEATNNAVKHADAREIVLTLRRRDDGALVLQVADDGVGLPPGHGRGLGLRTMHYRARLLGADLAVESGGADEGTVVTCTLPPSAS